MSLSKRGRRVSVEVHTVQEGFRPFDDFSFKVGVYILLSFLEFSESLFQDPFLYTFDMKDNGSRRTENKVYKFY